jgi:hypothetical protein
MGSCIANTCGPISHSTLREGKGGSVSGPERGSGKTGPAYRDGALLEGRRTGQKGSVLYSQHGVRARRQRTVHASSKT